MIIAIYTRQLPKLTGTDYLYDSINYFIQLALKQPLHSFIFIGEKKHFTKHIEAKNIKWIALKEITGLLRWKLFQKFALPSILAKNKVDMLISINSLCCEIAIPQILFNPDLYRLNHSTIIRKNLLLFLQKKIPGSFKKADLIITNTAHSKNKIIADYTIEENKIKVIHDGVAKLNTEMIDDENEKTKELFAQGKEYFLYVGNTQVSSNLINLLKAFSIFKKRQKSNMQLLIVAKDTTTENHFIENLKTYKYRADVNFIPNATTDTVNKISAAAYAFITSSVSDSHLTLALNSINNQVPVIIDNRAEIQEIFKDAALYADMLQFEDIADKMMQLFKDEQQRSNYILQGKLLMKQYTIQNTVDLISESIAEFIKEARTKKLL